MYGMNWFDDALTKEDTEEKITEFNYEKFIHPELLKGVDTKSPEFIEKIRVMNFLSKTKYERLQEAKKKFSTLMPLLKGLSEKEQRSLVHLLQNKSDEDRIINSVTSNELKTKLAQVSE
jgi:phosphoglycerate-specific signal transduction histidine kinase